MQTTPRRRKGRHQATAGIDAIHRARSLSPSRCDGLCCGSSLPDRSGKQTMPRSSPLVLRLRLGPSRNLSRLVGAAYGGAAACAYLADIPGGVAGAVSVLAAWLMVRDLRRYAWLTSSSAIVELRRRAGGDWELHLRGGRVVRASLGPRGYVHPRIVALVFRIARGHTVRVPIAADMLAPAQFRVLRTTVRTRH